MRSRADSCCSERELRNGCERLMRFEIRAGDGILVLAGLVGLSGAVFALGLVAGYEMARQTQPDVNQISSTYPLANPPEKLPPLSEMAPAAEASPAVSSVPQCL